MSKKIKVIVRHMARLQFAQAKEVLHCKCNCWERHPHL